MRPVAIGRRNSLHLGSKEAGPKVAAIFSVIESCRRPSIPVREYLAQVLPGLRTVPSAAWPNLPQRPTPPIAHSSLPHSRRIVNHVLARTDTFNQNMGTPLASPGNRGKRLARVVGRFARRGCWKSKGRSVMGRIRSGNFSAMNRQTSSRS